MITDIAYLIYNQRNILKELKISPKQINLMEEWLNKPNNENAEEENPQNSLLREDSKIQQ